MRLKVVGAIVVFAMLVIGIGGLPKTGWAQSARATSFNVVLVHGAFADGSSWNKVIPLLEARGAHVIAVQNPLTSLADDVATTKRAIDNAPGRVILVGHSWAGLVITEAGRDPKVAALVYVAAFAPSSGQSLAQATKGFADTPGSSQVRSASGFLTLTETGINEDLAPDLSAAERRLLFATQGDWALKAQTEHIGVAAWLTKPSWFIVARNDRMIQPDLERAMAKKIHARTTVIPSSHVAMLAKPAEVAAVILKAADVTP
jgi:pimeloyl-ACP methyl ester carboxylesterase